jgi:hypothetical protein
MALTKTQRAVIEEVVRKADAGPLHGWGQSGERIDERLCKVWVHSWIRDELQAVLDNDSGKLSANRLRYEHVDRLA